MLNKCREQIWNQSKILKFPSLFQEWAQKAKPEATKEDKEESATGGEKRKRASEDSTPTLKSKKVRDSDSQSAEKKKPLSNTTNAKLAAFSFGK